MEWSNMLLKITWSQSKIQMVENNELHIAEQVLMNYIKVTNAAE